MKIKTKFTFNKKSEILQYFECQNPKLEAIYAYFWKLHWTGHKASEMVLEVGPSVDNKRIKIKPLWTISEE